MPEFGARLHEARITKGWNQETLANTMGLTQASISQFEKGQRLPTPANIQKFAEVLDVPVETLTGEDQGKFEYAMLMRNLEGLTPEALKLINSLAQHLKH